MSKLAQSLPGAEAADGLESALFNEEADFTRQAASTRARPIPRISIQAFCENAAMADIMQIAAEDRRLAKAHVSVHMGGIEAAVVALSGESDAESHHRREQPPARAHPRPARQPRRELRRRHQGHRDRARQRRGALSRAAEARRQRVSRRADRAAAADGGISNLYNNPDTDPVGQVYAFIGAKGGVGSSTICHNAAWTLSEILKSNVVIADLDLAFGTTGLDFNQDPVQGIADALPSPDRLDEVLLDRLLTKCSEHLSIFAAPVVLDRDYEISVAGCDLVIDVVRQNVPFVVVDLPHTWAPWSKRVLLQADEVVITAAPDLANLRNAKNIVDLVMQTRRNDSTPQLVMNMVNMPKRPEISVKEFESALSLKSWA